MQTTHEPSTECSVPTSAHRKLMFVIAAALAAGGVEGIEPGLQTKGETTIPAAFSPGSEVTTKGYLKTSKNYGVRIDRLSLDPNHVALSVHSSEIETDLGRVSQIGDLTDALPHDTKLLAHIEDTSRLDATLNGVRVEGRVFDLDAAEHAARLPREGLKINGTLPVEVTVRRQKRLDMTRLGHTESVIAVDFELPASFFDDVDWSLLA